MQVIPSIHPHPRRKSANINTQPNGTGDLEISEILTAAHGRFYMQASISFQRPFRTEVIQNSASLSRSCTDVQV